MPLELRPAARGYQIFLDGQVRYGGRAFTLDKALDHVEHLSRTEAVRVISKRTGRLKEFEKATQKVSGPTEGDNDQPTR
jgi:hypothetical protein